jgi:hypothetical protein
VSSKGGWCWSIRSRAQPGCRCVTFAGTEADGVVDELAVGLAEGLGVLVALLAADVAGVLNGVREGLADDEAPGDLTSVQPPMPTTNANVLARMPRHRQRPMIMTQR